jgi:hypothetical protein
MYSLVGVITRKINEVHFSLMMFHYGWFASLTLALYLLFEWILNDASKIIRILTYSSE